MKTLTLLALTLCYVSAHADDTTCVMIGNQLHCHTDRQTPASPSNGFDPSVIGQIGNTESESQHQMMCVTQAARAGLSRAQIVQLCLR